MHSFSERGSPDVAFFVPRERGEITKSEFGKISRRIRSLISAGDMSMAEFSRRTGNDPSDLSKIEDGKGSPAPRGPFKIRDALGRAMRGFFEEGPAGSDIGPGEVVESMRIVKKMELVEAKEN